MKGEKMTTRTAVTAVIRVETDGTAPAMVLAVFSGVAGTNRPGFDAEAYGLLYGHFTIDRGWYEQHTRPATPEEVASILPALEQRDYDVTVAKRMVWAA